MDKILIAIINYNRPDFLYSLLNSLELFCPKEFKIKIIDNGSDIEVKEKIKSFCSYEIIWNDKNIGQSAYKQVFESEDSDYFITIDDDVLFVPPFVLQRLLDSLKTLEKFNFAGLSCEPFIDFWTCGAFYDYQRQQFPLKVYEGINIYEGILGGWVAAYKSEKLRHASVFDAEFEKNRFFLEDGLAIKKLSKLNMKVGVLEGCRVYHASSVSHGKMYADTWEQKLKALYGKIPVNSKLYKVSGLVIALNEDDFLELCLNQIVDFCDEIIIMEGATQEAIKYYPDNAIKGYSSTDKTNEIIEEFVNKHKHIKVYHSQGQWEVEAHQRLEGISLCSGDYIFMVDADEFYSKQDLVSLEEILGIIKNTKILSICAYCINFFKSLEYELIKDDKILTLFKPVIIKNLKEGFKNVKVTCRQLLGNISFYPAVFDDYVKMYHLSLCRKREKMLEKLVWQYFCSEGLDKNQEGFNKQRMQEYQEYLMQQHPYFTGKPDRKEMRINKIEFKIPEKLEEFFRKEKEKFILRETKNG